MMLITHFVVFTAIGVYANICKSTRQVLLTVICCCSSYFFNYHNKLIAITFITMQVLGGDCGGGWMDGWMPLISSISGMSAKSNDNFINEMRRSNGNLNPNIKTKCTHSDINLSI